MNYKAAYDMIMELQDELKAALRNYPPYLDGPDYKVVQALAATYELQDYLANKTTEDLEDEIFREAMQEVAAEEGRRAIEENERLKADPELAMPEETHKRMMEFLCNSVSGSMALSSMDLTAEDKARIRLAADPEAAEEVVQQLIRKHATP